LSRDRWLAGEGRHRIRKETPTKGRARIRKQTGRTCVVYQLVGRVWKTPTFARDIGTCIAWRWTRGQA